ncbi:MAG: putative structural protein [Prokaryotic dsDNA virus sp.]|nr:MAG: putative structural protein [Prokaryotic dsDNA virus sp.]
MNKSVDERLIRPGEYIDALNVRLGSTEGTEIGAVENSKGNTKLTSLTFNGNPLSNPLCIGAYADTQNDTIYWFVTSDSVDMIVSYDVRNNILVKHIESTTVLNFNKQYLITGVDMIDDLLFFTDNLNPPRRINITENYPVPLAGVDQFSGSDILVIVQPPLEAPTVTLQKLPGEENYLESRFISFAYRYKYKNGEYSALSQFSDIAFEPKFFNFNAATMTNDSMENSFNSVNIGYNTGGENVVGIDICFRLTDGSVINVAEKIDKEASGFPDNSIQTIQFTNGKIYTTLAVDENLRLYDNVPLKAKALTIMGNRLMFGNYEEGYDIVTDTGSPIDVRYVAKIVSQDPEIQEVPITISHGVDYTIDTPTQISTAMITFDFPNGVDLKENSQFGFSGTANHVQFTGDTSGNPNASDQVLIDFIFTLDQDYTSVYALATSEAFIAAIGAATTATPTHGTVSDCGTAAQPGTLTDQFVCSVVGPGSDDTFTWVKTDFGITSLNQGFIITAIPGVDTIGLQIPAIKYVDNSDPADVLYEYFDLNITNSQFQEIGSRKSLHSNRDYEVGIVYMDEYLRSSTALVCETNAVYTQPQTSVKLNKIRVTLTSPPPFWATKYKFVVKRVQSTYETLYANLYFQGENTSSVFYQLLGQNQVKAETGDTLIVKADGNGPRENLVKTQILSIEAKEEDFIEGDQSQTDDVEEPAGLYMELKPRGFIGTNEADEFSSVDNGVKSAGSRPNKPRVDYPVFPESLTDAADPLYEAYDLPAGSLVTFEIRFNRNDRGSDCGQEFYEKNFTVQATQDYPNLHSMVLGENVVFTGGDSRVTGDEVPNQNVFYPTLATSSSEGVGGNELFFTNGVNKYQFFKTQPSGGRMFFGVRSGTQKCGGIGPRFSYLQVHIRAIRAANLMVFETVPKDADVDLYFEGSKNYNITNGFHEGNIQNQTATDAAIVDLSFFDCFSFGNGVESYKILDNLDGRKFDLGVRVTSVSEQDYKKADRFAGITYSGVFNNESNVNRLNEFNLGLANFKNLEKNYGAIQVLSPRETDILVLQEDRISYVLAGKNLLSDLSGTGALTSVPEVLGQQIARLEEYGNSFNPESFATFGTDKYFTDAKRGAVIKLSGTGYSSETLEVISKAGMRSFFRDEFTSGFNTQKIGGYDPYMNEYVLSSNNTELPKPPPVYTCDQSISQVAAASSYTFVIDYGTAIGDSSVGIQTDNDIDITIAYNGVDVVDLSITAPGQTVTFSKPLNFPTTATFTVRPTNGATSYTIVPRCVATTPLQIIQIALTSAQDAGKFIHNQYEWQNGSDPISPLSSEQILFLSGDQPLVSSYISTSGFESIGVFPVDGANVTMKSNKILSDDFDFDTAQDNFSYLSSATLYQNNTSDIETLIPLLQQATPISNPSTGLYQASFTYNTGNPYLYMVWDYRKSTQIELCYDATSELNACCDCGVSPPACPDRRLVFQICNSNSLIDDNFEIFLNNVSIGTVNLNQNAQIGAVFIASTSNTETITSSDFVCPLTNMTTNYFNPDIVLGGTNTIFMKNIQNNGNGNFGTIGVRNYLLTGSNLSDPLNVADLTYSGASGSDFTLTFNYNDCGT